MMTHRINAFAAFGFLGILSGGVLVRFVAEGLRGNGSVGLTLAIFLMAGLLVYSTTALVGLFKANTNRYQEMSNE